MVLSAAGEVTETERLVSRVTGVAAGGVAGVVVSDTVESVVVDVSAVGVVVCVLELGKEVELDSEPQLVSRIRIINVML